MKRQWDIEELIEHFTLIQEDLDLLTNKSGPTRLGFALLLKCFQYEGRFPHGRHDIVESQLLSASNGDYFGRKKASWENSRKAEQQTPITSGSSDNYGVETAGMGAN